jgi:hypothetical protein
MKNIKNNNQNQFCFKKNRFQQLKGFYFTALLGSVSKASRALNVSQSAITIQIQSLERGLEVNLLNRNNKPLTLTKNGKILYEMISPLINDIDNILENFIKQKHNDFNVINIAIEECMIFPGIISLINNLIKDQPETKVKLISINSSNISSVNLNGFDVVIRGKNCNETLLMSTISKDFDIFQYNVPFCIFNSIASGVESSNIKTISDLSSFSFVDANDIIPSGDVLRNIFQQQNIYSCLKVNSLNSQLIANILVNNKNLAIILPNPHFFEGSSEIICHDISNIASFFDCLLSIRQDCLEGDTSVFFHKIIQVFDNCFKSSARGQKANKMAMEFREDVDKEEELAFKNLVSTVLSPDSE